MKKTILVMVAALFVGGLLLSNSLVKAEEDKGPAEITLTTPAAKKPVMFPHHKHQERMKCDECHKNANFAAAADKWTKEQGHALCKDCHKANKGPTKCNDCHTKGKKKKLEGC